MSQSLWSAGRKVSKPTRILPKEFWNDPLADPPPITEDDLKTGICSLV